MTFRRRMTTYSRGSESRPNVLISSLTREVEGKKRGYKPSADEDIFYLFRFAMTGNPVGAPIGDISEVITRKAVV